MLCLIIVTIEFEVTIIHLDFSIMYGNTFNAGYFDF